MDTDVLLFAKPKEILDYLDEQFQQDQYQVTKLIIKLNKQIDASEHYLNELRTDGKELYNIELRHATRKFNAYYDQYANLLQAKKEMLSTDIGFDFKITLIDDIIETCCAKMLSAQHNVKEMFFDSWLSSKISLTMATLERQQQDLQLLLNNEYLLVNDSLLGLQMKLFGRNLWNV